MRISSGKQKFLRVCLLGRRGRGDTHTHAAVSTHCAVMLLLLPAKVAAAAVAAVAAAAVAQFLPPLGIKCVLAEKWRRHVSRTEK